MVCYLLDLFPQKEWINSIYPWLHFGWYIFVLWLGIDWRSINTNENNEEVELLTLFEFCLPMLWGVCVSHSSVCKSLYCWKFAKTLPKFMKVYQKQINLIFTFVLLLPWWLLHYSSNKTAQCCSHMYNVKSSSHTFYNDHYDHYVSAGESEGSNPFFRAPMAQQSIRGSQSVRGR